MARVAAILRSHHAAIDAKLLKLSRLRTSDEVKAYRDRLERLTDAEEAAPELVRLIKTELKNDPAKEARRIKGMTRPCRRKSDGA